jgi:hypothetical protein
MYAVLVDIAAHLLQLRPIPSNPPPDRFAYFKATPQICKGYITIETIIQSDLYYKVLFLLLFYNIETIVLFRSVDFLRCCRCCR